MSKLAAFHYRKSLIAWLLLPLAGIYFLIILLRKYLHQRGVFQVKKFHVPVIVVGNITLGGAGKTPLVIYLVELLRRQGYKPGVVSRGYGAKASAYPCRVSETSSAREVGDEPLLIYSRTRVPVVVDPRRPRAAAYLLALADCDVIISDDGLQHYALARDIEIAVIDSARGFGNGFLFPAGPLRESTRRLTQVDYIIYHGSAAKNETQMRLLPGNFINLKHPKRIQAADAFRDQDIIAMAGIAHPERFFQTLTRLGLNFVKHPLPDHYPFTQADFALMDDKIIIMTEKDAVKVKDFAAENMWYLPVEAEISADFAEKLLQKLKSV